ncbi:hypothetical protein DOY81_003113 [Sarcophaga bullata]|nr:hypothetical protein DOY81_003113 [Sarcophaga bullata]
MKESNVNNTAAYEPIRFVLQLMLIISCECSVCRFKTAAIEN